MKTILVLDPQKSSASALVQLFTECTVIHANNADQAIELASEQNIDAVIVELSLGGHSGFEFLYEFRSYPDWINTPVFVYTTVLLSDEVLASKGWEALNITGYLYKPTYSLVNIKGAVLKALQS